ncbi:acetyltransferase [Thermophilibacter sp. ET337]|uniref:acetyltransferase n=1 Tax=Thermophilibacter sp. ET337 TaxID=2973084 RepID=UPI0021ACC1BD|nr:acetyltransferase [Thermophilibacter sp. ET337]MCR8907831.1 acetyltransferase [Thermophilibacter sp. ET337]
MTHCHTVADRTPELVEQLVDVWERSVRATHTFLSEVEVAQIKPFVPQALAGVETLVTAEKDGVPVGFMGVEGGRLEMLFLDPDVRGQGLGRQLLEHGIERLGVTELTVNEQNPQAVGFYEHLGFSTYRRTELDEQGRPYPLLYMRR